MEKIYSHIDPKKLLHIVVRKSDMVKGRINLIPEEHFIQCSSLNLEKGTTFKPHQHIWKRRTIDTIAQESWVVIQGRVKCIFYDTNSIIIAERVLMPGDASFTLEGGHNYMILDNDSLIYEMKTGPYEGQQLDKKFI